MRKGILVPLTLALFSTACVDAEFVDSTSEPIIGGVASVGGDYPTTVAISNGGLCTGTLIAPDLVLTAAHCILPQLLGANSQEQVTSQTQIIFDADNVFGGSGTARRVVATIPHPDFSMNSLGDNDIGLIRLQTPMTDRAPTPINRVHDDAMVGISVTQVGYGATEVGGQGAGRLFALASKKTTSCSGFGASDAKLLCFSQTDGQGKCQGDSGGPSFATINGVERVVGVTSFGDQSCAQFGADTRTDAELDFLYANAPELQCQAEGSCNEDCGRNGLPVDEDCTLCTKDSECEAEEICQGDGRCVPAPFTPGGDGSECSANEDCGSNICASSDEGSICTSTCTTNEECSDGLECISAGGDQNVCWPEQPDTGGCSVGGQPGAPLGALFIGLAMFFGLGRRRRQVTRR
jgi:MYXO-CTERM domain-containing protein